MSTNKDDSLLNAKDIYDITKFTHLDYPGKLACIIWFSGCNMRCEYCYNSEIVFSKEGCYSYINVLSFLRTRIHLLDAVVLSGGEASSYNLVKFCKKIKELGFLIKLDTNGTNHKTLKELIELELLDYVALDYKAPKEKFTQITLSKKYDEFSQTLNLLIQSGIDYEVRTTIHNDLLNEQDINTIIDDLLQRGHTKAYYLQEFLDTGSSIANLKAPLHSFDRSLLSNDLEILWR